MRGLLSLIKKYNYVIIFVFLEIIAFVLLSGSNFYQRSRIVNFHREISGNIYERVEGARLYLNLKSQNYSLNQEIQELHKELELLKANQKDSSIVSADSLYTFIRGKVVNATYHKQFNYLTINKGKNDSVNSDMAVIGPEGVVGIVLESSKNFATILPVINRDFRLSAKIKKNNFRLMENGG